MSRNDTQEYERDVASPLHYYDYEDQPEPNWVYSNEPITLASFNRSHRGWEKETRRHNNFLDAVAERRAVKSLLTGVRACTFSARICLFKPEHRLPTKEKKEKENIAVNREAESRSDSEQEVEVEVLEETVAVRQVEPDSDDSESDSDSEVELPVAPAPAVKPTVKREKEDTTGFVPVQSKRNRPKERTPPTKPVEKKTLNRLCSLKDRCRKSWCQYAHSVSELQVPECRFGKNCRWVEVRAEKYRNVPRCRPCNFIHPREEMREYLQRVKS